MLDFHKRTGLDPVDPIAFRSWLETESDLYAALGGGTVVSIFLEELTDLELSTPESVAGVLKYRANKRRQIESAQELQLLLSKKEKKGQLDRDRISYLTDQIRSLELDIGYDPLENVVTGADIAKRAEHLWELPDFLATPFPSLNVAMGYSVTGGFCKGAVHSVLAASGKGKALALDTPIPTPTGWTTMGELEVGDFIYGSDGFECKVTNTSQVFIDHPCYKLTFSDKTSIVADEDHLWEIECPSSWTGPKVVRTADIPRGRTVRVPTMSALKGMETDFIIDPYVLGAWLGDGHSNAARITSADHEIVDQIAETEPIWHAGVYRYDLTERTGSGNAGSNPFIIRLRRLNVLNNKHIPMMYLRASFANRLSLLQGLMDTDGTATRTGRNGISRQLAITLTNERLAKDTLELIRSLGITATMRTGRATLYGRYIGPKYIICFITSLPIFKLERKLVRQREWLGKGFRKTIRKIESVATVPTKCIEVSSLNNLFLAGEGFIPTHNSTFCKVLMNHWVEQGYTVLYVNYEEAVAHWERILFTQITKRNVYLGGMLSDTEKNEATTRFSDKMISWGDRFMVKHDPDTPYFDDLEKWLRDLIGHNDRLPDVVIIDTIQSMFMKGAAGKPRWGQFEEMMVRLEKLAKDLGSVVIITAQENSNRMKERREVVQQSDIGGSLAIAQKSSVAIFITQKRIAGDESEDEFIMQLQIPKNRITGSVFTHQAPLVRYDDTTKSYTEYEPVSETLYDPNRAMAYPDEFDEDVHR